jgi:hypothetical protein
MVEMRVQRVDVASGRLGKFARNGAGAVRVPATIARTGVQEYPGAGPNGSTLLEYRPPEEVFSADSLASLGSVPVTLRHPPAGVNPDNAKDVQVGHVSDTPAEARVKLDGSAEEWIRAQLVIADGAVQADIEAGRAGAISCGYSCDLEMTAGVTADGKPYHAIQRNIRFNHVAILTADERARAGADAKFRLDNKGTNQMKIIVIDGVEYEQGSDKHLNKVQSDAAAAVSVATARADKAEAERDTQKERADKAEAAATPDKLDALVEARLNLLQRAAKFLPATYDTKGKSDAQVRADAVSAKIGADKIAGKSPEYIAARFDGLCDASGDAAFHVPTKADAGAVSGAKTNINDDDEAFRAALKVSK